MTPPQHGPACPKAQTTPSLGIVSPVFTDPQSQPMHNLEMFYLSSAWASAVLTLLCVCPSCLDRYLICTPQMERAGHDQNTRSSHRHPFPRNAFPLKQTWGVVGVFKVYYAKHWVILYFRCRGTDARCCVLARCACLYHCWDLLCLCWGTFYFCKNILA